MSDIDEIEMREQARMSARESEEALRKELRELIEQWRGQVERAKDAGASYEHWKAVERKADELEELLND